tara:strand:- start:234559 stop:235317 length:759 start_codon:yes stop_codon:yes gene_type:complete
MNFYNSNKLKSINFDINPNDESLGIDTLLIKLMCPGQMRLCSSLLWTTTMLTSDHLRTGDNEASWMYYRFNLISELDPYFYSNYSVGGTYLSIVKDEPKNAKKLFEKGLKFYSKDFNLNYYAGFNDLYELNNTADAKKKYQAAYEAAPSDSYKLRIANTLSKISTEAGKLEEAYRFLSHIYKNSDIDNFKKGLEIKLYAIKAELDLNCLNQRRRNCSQHDFYGSPYLLKQGIYVAPRIWEPYRFKGKKKGTH